MSFPNFIVRVIFVTPVPLKKHSITLDVIEKPSNLGIYPLRKNTHTLFAILITQGLHDGSGLTENTAVI